MMRSFTNNLSKKYPFLPLFCAIITAVVIIDQVLKQLIFNLRPHLDLGILDIILVKNTGAGFGMLQGQNTVLAAISVLAAIGIIWKYRDIPAERWPQVFFALLLGGVMGNGLDRIFRTFVIDFISFSFWPAFNIADSAISIAAVGLIIYFWNHEK